MSYTILTDSCCDLSQQIVDEINVRVIPMGFEIGGKKYLNYSDNREISTADFFKLMREKQVATTSQVTPENYLQYFAEEYEQGRPVLVMAFSSALSGTCNAAFVARMQFVEDHPDAEIVIFDTLAACGGEGLMVYYAAQNRAAGMTLEENVRWLEEHRRYFAHRFTVDDLGTLKRGGRLSATSAFLGTLIGIKPVLHVSDEGKLVPTDKVRGRRNAIERLYQYVKDTITNPEEQVVFINDADDRRSAEALGQSIKENLRVKDVVYLDLGPVIGAHAGPGTIAVFFLGTKR